ncbi:carbonyl reductase [NADPH] 1 [Anabrus simplex]|uniref:carbonyl reductase [NADPH] 1 n=1 Tax=Anabrus simplex TaxID=316456 RepID=UPI0034DDA9D5
MASSKVAVVTGGNKGIGFEIVKGLCKKFDGVVYLTARDISRGVGAVSKLQELGLKPKFHQLDITDQKSLNNFKKYLQENYGGLDVLVNNAAIAYKVDATEPFAEQAKNTIAVNYFSLLATCHTLFPLLRPHARVVNLSSSYGHLSRIPGQKLRDKLSSSSLTEEQLSGLMNAFVKSVEEGNHQAEGWPNSCYQVSKVGVSALTFIQQRAFNSDPRQDIVVNAVHPGYVQTDMSSNKGDLTPEQGADAAIYLALLPANIEAPRGAYIWWDRRIVDWVNKPDDLSL